MDTLLAIGAVVLAAIVAYLSGNRKGRNDERTKAERDALRDYQQRLDRGRDAVAGGRDSGATPDERVRKNDGKW